jgi:hypothetical protein
MRIANNGTNCSSKAMFEQTHSSDNVSAQHTERSSLEAKRRRSSFANLTQILFGTSFSSDDESRSEVSNPPASPRGTAPSMTNMLVGLCSVDEDIIEDDDDRGIASIPVDELPYRYREATSSSSLTLESEGLVLTILKSKKLASENIN